MLLLSDNLETVMLLLSDNLETKIDTSRLFVH